MKRLDLSIGDLAIAIESGPDGPELTATGASGRFTTGAVLTPHVRILARWGAIVTSGPKGRLLFDSGGVWTLHEQGDELLYRFRSPSFGDAPYKEARLTRALSAGEVVLRRNAFAPGREIYPIEYPLDELIVTHRLARSGGVELHGCGLIDPADRGFLFLGPSGAGKTTMARLWMNAADAVILSDDRIIVREAPDELRMWGTPWHGEEELAEPRSHRLDRVFLLRHASENTLTTPAPSAALAKLFSCSFPPFHDPAAVDGTLATLARLLDRVPCNELEFVPDESAVSDVLALV